MVYATIIGLLEQSGAAYRVHAHPAVVTIDEARRTVPHLTRHLIKTVVFQLKDAEWILAAVPGGDRIHYRQLADALGVKRTALRSVPARRVATELGFEIGGIGPFAIRDDVRVVFDATLPLLNIVYCGSGRNTRTIQIGAADLIALSRGIVYPIRRPPARP